MIRDVFVFIMLVAGVLKAQTPSIVPGYNYYTVCFEASSTGVLLSQIACPAGITVPSPTPCTTGDLAAGCVCGNP